MKCSKTKKGKSTWDGQRRQLHSPSRSSIPIRPHSLSSTRFVPCFYQKVHQSARNIWFTRHDGALLVKCILIVTKKSSRLVWTVSWCFLISPE
ncbi:unnamed protein product [Arabidopsis halleri]